MDHIQKEVEDDRYPDLFTCAVCGCSEAQLPTECPGKPVDENIKEKICKGEVDFIDGRWTLDGVLPEQRDIHTTNIASPTLLLLPEKEVEEEPRIIRDTREDGFERAAAKDKFLDFAIFREVIDKERFQLMEKFKLWEVFNKTEEELFIEYFEEPVLHLENWKKQYGGEASGSEKTGG